MPQRTVDLDRVFPALGDPIHPFPIDHALDLVLERTVPVPPGKVWAAWPTPEVLMQWYTPAPYKTVECVIDLWSGLSPPPRRGFVALMS
jgi:hypothetical protein